MHSISVILLWEDCGNSAAININLHMKRKKNNIQLFSLQLL